ncbi:hypothetical protein [Ralstonia wenshanensis]|uniref:hypothetical protein n=1 Tax=Ralstonia wenshanensis TaxID=2842456 RepID=UPI003D96C339
MNISNAPQPAAQQQTAPWQRVLGLFQSDDGSLPDLFVRNLTRDQVVAVYEWVMSLCKASENASAWLIKEKRNVQISALPAPAQAFVEGEIELFRHGLVGLSIAGVELPYLTISVESIDCVSFDYRKGPEWTEPAINALLEMLARIHALAPNALIEHAEEGSSRRPTEQFAEALREFEGTRA